jgi:hypothetical protein
MTAALASLRQYGVLALPVHDSLIVPLSAAAAAREAIGAAYFNVCGVKPGIKKKFAVSRRERPRLWCRAKGLLNLGLSCAAVRGSGQGSWPEQMAQQRSEKRS